MSNPEKAQPGWPAVLVAGAFQTGVVLMRDLRRRGLEVSVCDCNGGQPGFRTIYGSAYLCPNPDLDPSGWLTFMIHLRTILGGRPVLIPSADQFVSAIARYAAELEPHYIFCASAMAAQELLATKRRQYDVAERHGMPVPKTRLLASLADVRDFISEASFPCLIKPIHFRDWESAGPGHPLYGEKLTLADSPAELEQKYLLAAEIHPEMIAQEIIQGPDTEKLVYLSCYGRSGERIASAMLRQIRTMPINFGSASVVQPVHDPEADAVSDAFLRGIGYVGICELELKRDTRDGIVRLIEANPRYSVTMDAGSYIGVDIGWIHYLDLIGEPVEPVSATVSNLRHIVLTRDAACLRQYRQAGLVSWSDIIRSYRPPVAFFDFDFRDWRVTLTTVITVTKTLLYPIYRRLVPKKQSR